MGAFLITWAWFGHGMIRALSWVEWSGPLKNRASGVVHSLLLWMVKQSKSTHDDMMMMIY